MVTPYIIMSSVLATAPPMSLPASRKPNRLENVSSPTTSGFAWLIWKLRQFLDVEVLPNAAQAHHSPRLTTLPVSATLLKHCFILCMTSSICGSDLNRLESVYAFPIFLCRLDTSLALFEAASITLNCQTLVGRNLLYSRLNTGDSAVWQRPNLVPITLVCFSLRVS